MKEIFLNKDYKDKILSGINKLADTVLLTMGPNGNTVILYNEEGKPYPTKDGVSVAKSISFEDPVEDAAATMIKEVAQRTVEQAGDGTTTSICLAQAFINKGFELLENEERSHNDLINALSMLELEALHYLKKQSRKLSKKDIIHVATIASNNDINIGRIIDKAYKHSNIVRVEESNSEEDSLELVNGMQIDAALFDRAFINNIKKQSIEYDKCKLIIFNGKIDNISQISTTLEGPQELPIVIMADHFSNSVVSILKSNYNDGNLLIGLIKSPSFATHRRDLISDIISYTKAYHSIKTPLFITQLDSIYVDKNKTIFTKKEVNVDKRVNDLKEAYKEEKDKNSKKLLKERIDNLEGKLSIINVGGGSNLEIKERKDRIEDAVLAVKSAMEEGVVDGGGVALVQVYESIKNIEYPLLGLLSCLLTPRSIITSTDIYSIKDDVLDPHKVTRCALQNAISVSKAILSSKAIVLNYKQW